MFSFNLYRFARALSEINIMIEVAGHNARVGDIQVQHSSEAVFLNDEYIQDCSRTLPFITETLAPFASVHMDEALRSATRRCTNKTRWSEAREIFLNLRNTIYVELRNTHCYRYPKLKAEKLITFKDDWQAVMKSFRSCWNDALAATDCYAMGSDTASVFHSMRVIEHGIRALAADVGLTFDVQNWQNVIEEIRAKISEAHRTLPRGSAKSERLQFLSEAATEVGFFKDAWRNHVAHGRAWYDEGQALNVLEHTRTFMTVLASRLSEPATGQGNSPGPTPA